jgi:hypothetical protein
MSINNDNFKKFFINVAKKFGNLKYAKHYINTDYRLSENKLDTYNNLPVSNPLFFLTGLKKSEEIIDQEDCSYQGMATPPCITCIVGEYGKGKTELIIQVTRFMLQNIKESKKKVLPLPINLALCRTQLEELNTFEKSNKEKVDSFSKLLFNHLSLPSQEIDLKFIKEELIPEIQKGNVFLLLDGLDELLSHQDNIKSKHKLFFDYLINFLNFNLDNANIEHNTLAKLRRFDCCRNIMNTTKRSKLGKNLG